MQPICYMAIQKSQLSRGGDEKSRAFVEQHAAHRNQEDKYLSL
jgi:hypothetical protein